MIIAICPGSFDPIQNGHIDIIKRASMLADKVYVVIGINPDKEATFSIKEKIKMLKKALKGINNIEIAYNDGLTVDFAKKVNASLIIKGYRNLEDLKYEEDMAVLNKRLNPQIVTIILKSSLEYDNISSSSIKELVLNGEDISSFIPKQIQSMVIKKIKKSV